MEGLRLHKLLYQMETVNLDMQTLRTDIARFVNRFGQSVCGLPTVVLRGKSITAGNIKINANFLFGGFIASYKSLCVIKQLCFVSTVVRKLPQIKNFVYPLCVIGNYKNVLNKHPHNGHPAET